MYKFLLSLLFDCEVKGLDGSIASNAPLNGLGIVKLPFGNGITS